MRRRVIELSKKGVKPKEIQEILNREYGEHALGRSAIYKWAAKAKLGYEEAEDEHRAGRPIDDQLLTRVISPRRRPLSMIDACLIVFQCFFVQHFDRASETV